MYRIPDFIAWLPALFFTLRLKNGKENHVYLTFDDGPDPGSTTNILSKLSEYDVKASFFITGERAEKFPDIVDAVRNEGHKIHLHGYQHKKLKHYGKEELFKDLRKCQKLLNSNCLRPPYGKVPLRFFFGLKKQGYRIILWNVDFEDYKPGEIDLPQLTALLRKIRKGDILLLHDKPDNIEKTMSLIQYIITFLKAKGITFSTII